MWADLVAGWLSGCAGLVVGHPMDTVKARLQTMPGAFSGILDVFLKTAKQESVFALYKGMSFPFWATGALNAILFTGYGQTIRYLHPETADGQGQQHRTETPMSSVVLATTVGAAAQLVPAIPIELIKTRLQVQQHRVDVFGHAVAGENARYGGPAQCAGRIWRERGLRGFYQGGAAMTVRDFIGWWVYLPGYHVFYKKLLDLDCHDTWAQFFAGGFAGAASWFSVCPCEVVKNRIQVQETGGGRPSGVFSVIFEVLKADGPKGFFRGGLTMALRGFPVNAVLFVVYEQTMKVLG